jgi:hypothetical protein
MLTLTHPLLMAVSTAVGVLGVFVVVGWMVRRFDLSVSRHHGSTVEPMGPVAAGGSPRS